MARHILAGLPVASGALIVALGAVGALAFGPVAHADPDVPVPPVVPADPGPAPVDPVTSPPSVRDTAGALFGAPNAAPGIPGGPGADYLLSQYAAPALPGGAAAAPPTADVLQQSSSFLIPQNYRVPTPDQISPYVLPEGTPGPFARVDGLKGMHAMVHGALGRMSHEQLSEPLPGTAPPPGTVLPAGPVQNLPDDPTVLPGLVLPPAPPEPPVLPAPAG